MDISLHDIIRGPWVTEKAYDMNRDLKKLVLRVHTHANKVMIAQALKRLFNVDVDKVAVIVVNGKRRRSGRFVTTSPKRKKAIVTLKSGQSLDMETWSAPAEVEGSPS